MKLKRALATILSLAIMLTGTSGLMPTFAEEAAPAAEAPAAETPKPTPKPTPVPATPVPATPVPATPVPATPVPATPVPATPVPATPVPATPVPATPVPATPVPATPVPATPVPEAPESVTPVPATPVPQDQPGAQTEQPSVPAEQTPAPATPAPAEQTSSPTAAPTSTPADATATPEPSQTPAATAEAARIVSLSAASATGLVGQSMSFYFSASGAASLRFRLAGPGGTADSGALSGGATSYSFTPDRAGSYTFELTAIGTDGAEVAGRAAVEIVEAPALRVAVKSAVRSAFAGDSVAFTLSRSAASQLASCQITAVQGGTVVYSSDSFVEKLSVLTVPSTLVTDLTLTVTLTDIYQQTAKASVTVPCAVHAPETYKQYSKAALAVAKTGVWPQDLVAVARSQVGYRESTLDFIIDEEGERQGYTRYGDWYGLTYEGWCAMFACFCMHFAGISHEDFPYCPNPYRWIKALRKAELYADRTEHEPRVGDLAFFDWQVNDHADHVGIISAVNKDATGHVVSFETIEGNSTNYAVTSGDIYYTSDARVTGYGLVNWAYQVKFGLDRRALTSKTKDYTVVAEIKPEAKVPDSAVFQVEDFAPDTAEYQALSAQVEAWIASEGKELLSFARFFKINLVGQGGVTVFPQAPVSYSVTYKTKIITDKTLQPCVIAFDSVGGIKKLASSRFENVDQDGARVSVFSFELDPRQDNVSTIGVIVSGQPVYEAGSLSFSCGTYGLRIDFDSEDEVPQGSTLSAMEYRAGTADYQSRLEAARAALDLAEDQQIRIFEIGINNSGMAVEPARPVDITVTCPGIEGSAVKVLRLDDGAVLSATLARSGDAAEARFGTNAFGAFCLVFEN